MHKFSQNFVIFRFRPNEFFWIRRQYSGKFGINRFLHSLIIIFKNICLFVLTLTGSAPGHDRTLRPVSLEPAWPEVETFEKNFPEKWPVTKLPNPTNAFLWEKIVLKYTNRWRLKLLEWPLLPIFSKHFKISF